MTQPYIGEIRMFGFTFAPRNYAFCDGQIMSIAQNVALFSIIGTTYGGDGVSTFALPDLRGARPMHWGTGTGVAAGLTTAFGEVGGSANVTLAANTLPAHNHPLLASTGPPTSSSPTGAALSTPLRSQPPLYSAGPPGVAVSDLSSAGGGVPFSILQPYLAVGFCIALYGIFPSRN
jgi:microcystin-dependent protein